MRPMLCLMTEHLELSVIVQLFGVLTHVDVTICRHLPLIHIRV